jgi:predicted nucleotidyltransferase
VEQITGVSAGHASGGARRPVPDHDLVRHFTVYACVVGSRAYGLQEPASDVDRRGVFCPPTELFWYFDKPPTHVDGPEPERFSWELERFCALALQANPTVLECLWSPLVEQATEVGEQLLARRGLFLSRRVGETYGRYAADQMNRLAASLRRTGLVRWKQAMHMIRLLIAGGHVLTTGEVLVDVSAYRDRLLAVRRGELAWEDVSAWAAELTRQLATAAADSPLPAEPDRDGIQDFLIATRRALSG